MNDSEAVKWAIQEGQLDAWRKAMEDAIRKKILGEKPILYPNKNTSPVSPIPVAKEPHYNHNPSSSIPYVFCPSMQCPECWFQVQVEKIDDLRIRIRHPQHTSCSRSLEEVLRPIADFVKFI